MATLNEDAQNSQIQNYADDFATATLAIREGTTVLATHTLVGYGAPASGTVNANPISSATNVGAGTADNALLTAGAREVTLTVSDTPGPGVDVVIDDLVYQIGGTNSITGFAVTQPASS